MKNKLPLIWKNMFQAQGFLEKEVSKKKKKPDVFWWTETGVRQCGSIQKNTETQTAGREDTVDGFLHYIMLWNQIYYSELPFFYKSKPKIKLDPQTSKSWNKKVIASRLLPRLSTDSRLSINAQIGKIFHLKPWVVTVDISSVWWHTMNIFHLFCYTQWISLLV